MKLIIGYGNPDREDDGLAWHALCAIAQRLHRPVPTFEDGFNPSGLDPDLWFVLQLTPEMAEDLSGYDELVFVDAHTGAYAEFVRVADLQPAVQTSPLTHHLTPEMLLALAAELYGLQPRACLVSIKGESFGFRRGLTYAAEERLLQALPHILD
jgi:hydrogenase maturation protease